MNDSTVGIAACYRLGGPGIESQRVQDSLHPSRSVLGATQPPIQWVLGHSEGCGGLRWLGCCIGHPPPSQCQS